MELFRENCLCVSLLPNRARSSQHTLSLQSLTLFFCFFQRLFASTKDPRQSYTPLGVFPLSFSFAVFPCLAFFLSMLVILVLFLCSDQRLPAVLFIALCGGCGRHHHSTEPAPVCWRLSAFLRCPLTASGRVTQTVGSHFGAIEEEQNDKCSELIDSTRALMETRTSTYTLSDACPRRKYKCLIKSFCDFHCPVPLFQFSISHSYLVFIFTKSANKDVVFSNLLDYLVKNSFVHSWFSYRSN